MLQANWRGVISTSLGPGFYLFLSGLLLYVPCLVIELSIPAGRWAIIGDLKAPPSEAAERHRLQRSRPLLGSWLAPKRQVTQKCELPAARAPAVVTAAAGSAAAVTSSAVAAASIAAPDGPATTVAAATVAAASTAASCSLAAACEPGAGPRSRGVPAAAPPPCAAPGEGVPGLPPIVPVWRRP